jgi:8-oxo-dGTP pyrophosphatase MutT (NUDIX family)
MARTPIYAAGGIVVRGGRRRPLIAVVQRSKDEAWVLPRGKLKRDEDPVVGARREVVEETGHRVHVHEFVGAITYRARGRPKVVQFWRMQAYERPSRDVMKDIVAVEWLPLSAAVRRLSYPLEKLFLQFAGRRALKRRKRAGKKKKRRRTRGARQMWRRYASGSRRSRGARRASRNARRRARALPNRAGLCAAQLCSGTSRAAARQRAAPPPSNRHPPSFRRRFRPPRWPRTAPRPFRPPHPCSTLHRSKASRPHRAMRRRNAPRCWNVCLAASAAERRRARACPDPAANLAKI